MKVFYLFLAVFLAFIYCQQFPPVLNNCPPNLPLVQCSEDPCSKSGLKCSGECVSEFCGGCNSFCNCNTTSDCPSGSYCSKLGLCFPHEICRSVEDCHNQDNQWVHMLCLGYASCPYGSCAWTCKS